MPTFDFEDGLFPSSWLNADDEPWQVTTEDDNGGTQSLAANNTISDSQISSCYIIGDFEAGDFDCDYKISSENGFDFGFIVLDGVAVVDEVTGAGSWTAMTQQSISAGIHVIQFLFVKDGSSGSGTDTFYIDNVVLPTFTDLSADTDKITLASTVFTNDVTTPWVNAPSGGSSNSPFIGAESAGSSSLTYTSDSGAPAGDVFFVGFSTGSGASTLQLLIDSTVEQTNPTGQMFQGESYAPLAPIHAVTSGSHDYEILANASDMYAFLFYEPGFTVAAAGRIMSSLANAGGLAGRGGIAGKGGGLAG